MGQKKVLVTGAAGFIGYHLSRKLSSEGFEVFGLDNMNDYYDVGLKEARLANLRDQENFQFEKIDLLESSRLAQVVGDHQIEYIINLAAQAGVRYSLKNPKAYLDSNLSGFLNVLEVARQFPIKHLIFASSSSVYGANKTIPFSEKDNVDHPLSLYAATKKSNELMAHSYASLYGIPCTGLRFFTVYGPYGRPDMAVFLFTKAIIEGRPIRVFNRGQMKRDFTYIDDIVEGIWRLISIVPDKDDSWDPQKPDPSSSYAPYRIYNIGNNQSVELMRFIELIERNLGIEATKELLPMQDGDVEVTYANIDSLQSVVGYSPTTKVEVGISNFIRWYKDFYKVEVS